MSTDYPVTKQNKIRQLREKAAYDKATVHSILDAALVAHVGFVESGRPIVVPMIYGREKSTIYLHGARKARVIRLLERNDSACLNVTLVDGLVFARSAFNSSINYRSVTVFGNPGLVADRDEKLHALRVISERTMPGRWDELREPLLREIEMTGVIALDIESASAKVSSGMPVDEDEDYEIPIWAGVLPLETRLTTLVSDERVLQGVEPSVVVRALQGRTL
ncbi:MAG: pyridoxamine 5'-phosphate oxidase family protein [Gammaproteobacteria bacterium]|nr:pyridoxamine 5'-phosphate oxidase family protein [Gammaproteobacteria bacterium]